MNLLRHHVYTQQGLWTKDQMETYMEYRDEHSERVLYYVLIPYLLSLPGTPKRSVQFLSLGDKAHLLPRTLFKLLQDKQLHVGTSTISFDRQAEWFTESRQNMEPGFDRFLKKNVQEVSGTLELMPSEMTNDIVISNSLEELPLPMQKQYLMEALQKVKRRGYLCIVSSQPFHDHIYTLLEQHGFRCLKKAGHLQRNPGLKTVLGDGSSEKLRQKLGGSVIQIFEKDYSCNKEQLEGLKKAVDGYVGGIFQSEKYKITSAIAPIISERTTARSNEQETTLGLLQELMFQTDTPEDFLTFFAFLEFHNALAPTLLRHSADTLFFLLGEHPRKGDFARMLEIVTTYNLWSDDLASFLYSTYFVPRFSKIHASLLLSSCPHFVARITALGTDLSEFYAQKEEHISHEQKQPKPQLQEAIQEVKELTELATTEEEEVTIPTLPISTPRLEEISEKAAEPQEKITEKKIQELPPTFTPEEKLKNIYEKEASKRSQAKTIFQLTLLQTLENRDIKALAYGDLDLNTLVALQPLYLIKELYNYLNLPSRLNVFTHIDIDALLDSKNITSLEALLQMRSENPEQYKKITTLFGNSKKRFTMPWISWLQELEEKSYLKKCCTLVLALPKSSLAHASTFFGEDERTLMKLLFVHDFFKHHLLSNPELKDRIWSKEIQQLTEKQFEQSGITITLSGNTLNEMKQFFPSKEVPKTGKIFLSVQFRQSTGEFIMIPHLNTLPGLSLPEHIPINKDNEYFRLLYPNFMDSLKQNPLSMLLAMGGLQFELEKQASETNVFLKLPKYIYDPLQTTLQHFFTQQKGTSIALQNIYIRWKERLSAFQRIQFFTEKRKMQAFSEALYSSIPSDFLPKHEVILSLLSK